MFQELIYFKSSTPRQSLLIQREEQFFHIPFHSRRQSSPPLQDLLPPARVSPLLLQGLIFLLLLLPTPPRRIPTLPLLLPLLSSPIEAQHHSSIDLHCQNKLPIFRSSLRHDLQSSPLSSTLVVVALDAAFILDLLGHRTPPLLLVSSIFVLLLPVPNLTAVDPRHRFKFQFFWLFLRRNLLPLFLPKPTGRFPTFQSLLHLKGSISSIVGSAIPIFDLGYSYSVIHHRRFIKDRCCCLSRRHHGKARSPHSTHCLRFDRFSNSVLNKFSLL